MNTKIQLLFLLPVVACLTLTGCNTTQFAKKSRITHVVIVWFKPETPPDVRQKIEEDSRDLHRIPGVYNLILGQTVPSDRPIVDDSFDLALSMQFDSVADMDAYVVHPQHQEFLKLAKPNIAKLLVYDFR